MAGVRPRGALKQVAGDRYEDAVDGGSVGDLLVAIERARPASRGWMLHERGMLRPHINVFVNGELAAHDTPVGTEHRIDVLPALSAGR
jgi:sulfur-carrier protein